jgi:hypothetical protein
VFDSSLNDQTITLTSGELAFSKSCLDQFTVSNIDGNTASTSNDDIFGSYTICQVDASG